MATSPSTKISGNASAPERSQKRFNNRVFSKSQGLLGQVEALDLRAILFRPIGIGRKADQLLIDVHAADAGAATRRGQILECGS